MGAHRHGQRVIDKQFTRLAPRFHGYGDRGDLRESWRGDDGVWEKDAHVCCDSFLKFEIAGTEVVVMSTLERSSITSVSATSMSGRSDSVLLIDLVIAEIRFEEVQSSRLESHCL